MSEAETLLTGTVSGAQLAKLLGMSTRRVRELAQEGVIPREGSRFALPGAVTAYVEHLREVAAGRRSADASAETLDLVQERAALARKQRERIELELQRERGQLVDAEEAKAKYAGMVVAAKTRLIAVPSKSKARIPVLTVRDIEVLEALIAEALEELALAR